MGSFMKNRHSLDYQKQIMFLNINSLFIVFSDSMLSSTSEPVNSVSAQASRRPIKHSQLPYKLKNNTQATTNSMI